MKDPFSILECSSKSTKEEITKKYRSLALKYHPDRTLNLPEIEHKKAEEKFKEISCAYSFLEKHNFKYTHIDTNLEDFTSRFSMFSANFGKIGNILNTIRNMDLDNIANHILKEVNHIQDFYNGENEELEKSQDININARVDLIDIYNNVRKDIKIKCVKKCKLCMGLGYNINDKTKCIDCNGIKIKLEEINIGFDSYLKNKQLLRQGNEEPGKRPGNIFINIYPKVSVWPESESLFRVIDDYNIQHKVIITMDMLSILDNTDNNNDNDNDNDNDTNDNDTNDNDNDNDNDTNDKKSCKKIQFKYEIEYLDLKIYRFQIDNIFNEFMFEYEISSLGLLRQDNTRGGLKLLLIDKYNFIEKLVKNENIEIIDKTYNTNYVIF